MIDVLWLRSALVAGCEHYLAMAKLNLSELPVCVLKHHRSPAPRLRVHERLGGATSEVRLG